MSYSDDDEFGPDPAWMDGYTGAQEAKEDALGTGSFSPATSDLAALELLAPDAAAWAYRDIVLPAANGRAQMVREVIHVARYDRVVLLTVPALLNLHGVVTALVAPDNEGAQVAMVNQLDALRRDGWTDAASAGYGHNPQVPPRDLEPWEAARTDEYADTTTDPWAPVRRPPYVGEGADGARRSADIDRAEADTYPTGSEYWQDRQASAMAWERQADEIDAQQSTGGKQ